nr:hypothetical protein GCM10020063_028370 [Dactylosporangium thailandense]
MLAVLVAAPTVAAPARPALAAADGTLAASTSTVGSEHVLYYLSNDGYTWLAQPVRIQLIAAPGTLPLASATVAAGTPIQVTCTCSDMGPSLCSR